MIDLERFMPALALFALGATARANDQLVAPGAVWEYLDDGSDQGTPWREPGFDDSLWASGPAQLGYGEGDEATVVSFGPSASDKHITTYFRTTFDVPDPSIYISLRLLLLRDDGAVVYLNGAEIVRSNMPAGAIDYLTLASSTVGGASENAFFETSLDPALLLPGANHLAVEIHQRSGTSSDVSFDLELFAGTTPVVTRGPYLQLATPTSMRVVWKTDLPTDGRVGYGPSPGSLTSFVDDPAVQTKHEVDLTGLTPGTTYYYSVGTPSLELAGDDPEHFFVTSPPAGTAQPFRVWILGDSGEANLNAAAVRDAYYAFTGATHTDLWLMLGDNAYDEGTGPQYQAAVFDMYPEMLRKSALFPTRGNHEMMPAVYYGIFSMPSAGEAGGLPSGTEAYYSFDFANVHFVCLDSQGSSRAVGGPMWTWLEGDLAATGQDWIVAYWHHPPYTKGSHDSDSESQLIEMRQNFLELLEEGGVDLVFCGHSHSYERSFLVDGHYGLSTTFTDAMKVDGGDGREEGTGAYNKAAGPHAGAVYTTAGSSSKISGGPLNHPVMFHSVNVLGSVVLDFDGGRVDVRFLTATGQVNDSYTLLSDSYTGTYCISTPHSEGCAAMIGATGTPSATDVNPYAISASEAVANQFGILFYGSAPDNFPFLGGGLCVASPITRTAIQNGGGAGPCSGTFDFDFNAHIQSGVDGDLVPGETVYCQYWFRDPGGLFGSALSNALQFTIQP